MTKDDFVTLKGKDVELWTELVDQIREIRKLFPHVKNMTDKQILRQVAGEFKNGIEK